LEVFIGKVTDELIEKILIKDLHTVFAPDLDCMPDEVAQLIAAQTLETQAHQRKLGNRLRILQSALEICERHAPFALPFTREGCESQTWPWDSGLDQGDHEEPSRAELEKERDPHDYPYDDDYLPDATDEESQSDSGGEESDESKDDEAQHN
jgi:hypothetical protein